MNIKQIKNQSKQQVSDNLVTLVILVLIVALIGSVVAAIPVLNFIVGAILLLSQYTIYLNLVNKNQEPKIEDIQLGLKQWKEVSIMYFFMTLFICLWSLLLIIPGVIKSFSYSMCFYILAENPGMSGMEALKRSQEMMKGHKMDLFKLMLSYFWWICLCVITCGLAALYIGPFMYAAQVNFYNAIKGNATYAA